MSGRARPWRGAGRAEGGRPRRIGKLFIASRGEIALRVIRAARELGIATAVPAVGRDRELPYAQAAGEVIPLEAGRSEPYLDADLLVAIARRSGADALHPGYGFLSESAGFARAAARAGLLFIGPPPEALAAAGDKVAARRTAREAGVPVLPGAAIAPRASSRELSRNAAAVGYPLLVKAASGGGGRGIRRVEEESGLPGAAEAAAREARAAFGDGRIYLEKALEAPRHVEVQVLADGEGRIALFPERDCSVQRRHQKVIEESPSPAVSPALRRRLLAAAAKVARAMAYRNAGTVEFLLDGASGELWFLEVNARLQVEHPVTEAVTGTDLVAGQIRIASGEPLPGELAGAAVPSRGHAIECRITAEAPPDFRPSGGPLALFHPPSGPGVRFDAGYREGNVVETRYDSLLAKLIAWGPDRESARRRMEAALAETVVLGVDTTIDFLSDAIRHPVFRSGSATVDFIAKAMPGWSPPPPPEEVLAIAREIRRRRDPSGPPPPPEATRRAPWSAIESLRGP